MIKGSIHEGDKTILNIYAPNLRSPKYMKQILTELKEEIDSNKIIVNDFNTISHSKNGQINQIVDR